MRLALRLGHLAGQRRDGLQHLSYRQKARHRQKADGNRIAHDQKEQCLSAL